MKKTTILFVLLITSSFSLVQGQTAVDYFNSGVANYRKGDYRGAIQDYSKAIEIKPDLAEAYLNRGIAKSQLGDKNGACLDLSKAGELGYADAYELIRKYCN